VAFTGPSAFSFSIEYPSESLPQLDEASSASSVALSHDFELSFMPSRVGMSSMGGLRILLANDLGDESIGRQQPAQVLKEWESLGEIWVSA